MSKKIYVYSEESLTEKQLNVIKKINPLFLDIKSNFKGSPEKADYFVFPLYLCTGSNINGIFLDEVYFSILEELDYFKRYPKKHVLIDLSDFQYIPNYMQESRVFKPSATLENGSYALPYPVPFSWRQLLNAQGESYGIEKAEFDLGFQGTFSTNELRISVPHIMKLAERKDLKTYWFVNDSFFYFYDHNTRVHMSKMYYDSVLNCKFVYCPRGGGLSSYRCFEAMSVGRIPIIASDDLILPLADQIPWDDFSIYVKEGDIYSIPEKIIEFKKDKDLQKASKLGKHIWNTYFSFEEKAFFEFMLNSFNH